MLKLELGLGMCSAQLLSCLTDTSSVNGGLTAKRVICKGILFETATHNVHSGSSRQARTAVATPQVGNRMSDSAGCLHIAAAPAEDRWRTAPQGL